MSVPGIDHLGYQVDERLTADQYRSVANQCGKKRVMSELFGASGQGLTFRDRWCIAAQQPAFGVNLLVPHLALYTMAGSRKTDHPPNLSHQQPWWSANHWIDNALARLCWAVTQGERISTCLVLHPDDSAIAAWRVNHAFDERDGVLVRRHESAMADAEVQAHVAGLDDTLKRVCESVRRQQVAFDLGDESLLEELGSVSEADG
ncbi:MAG: hypothetical protein AAF797_06400 [Planctomycetota bacterium]